MLAVKIYLAATAIVGALAACEGGANPWQVAASAAVSPVLLPVALAHEVRCYVQEWGER